MAALAFALGVGLEERTIAAALPRIGADALTPTLAVVGCDRLDAAQVAQAAALPAGVPVAAVDPGEVAARLREHPWIRSARVVPLPPATVLVRVVEREPAAIAAASAGDDTLWALDETGVPFAPADDSLRERAPLLLGPDALPLAADAPPVPEALRLAGTLHAGALPPVRAIEMGPPDDPAFPRLHLRGLPAPVTLGPFPHDLALARLERLLEAAPPELGQAHAIDVRFAERAILEMSPSRTGTDPRRVRADARARPNRSPARHAGGSTPGG